MILQIFLATFLIVGASADDCSQADYYECSCSYCVNYYFSNDTCIHNSSNFCSAGQVYYGSSCVTCSTLGSTNCSTICPDYFYVSSVGSGPAVCTNCQTLFGTACIRCTASECTTCAISTNLILATNGLSCINSSCGVPNCLLCYNTGNRCYICQAGYIVNAASNFSCVSSSCTVLNCITCSGTGCANCFPGYLLTYDQLYCQPICYDPYCTNCIGPDVCSNCVQAFTAIDGICTLDCSQIWVENCYQCDDFYSCRKCNPGYTLVAYGTYCQVTCTVANCLYCIWNPGYCNVCQYGYDRMDEGTVCEAGFCYINYCDSCLTINTCSSCISGFILSSNLTKCTSNCTTSFPNCLFCNATRCTTCNQGYILNTTTGQCQMACNIANCISCYTSTLCQACATNYYLASGYTACNQVCRVTGCTACPSSTSNSCNTCSSGYSPSTTNGVTKCTKNCQYGQVNTGAVGVVNCQPCSSLISFCNQCSFTTSASINCESCVNGYFVNGQACDKCSSAIPNCMSCTGASICNQCLSGYKLISGACVTGNCLSTVPNCYYCLSTSTSLCNICNAGYALNSSNICHLQGCANTFVYNTTTLTCVCPISTYETNGVCEPCSDSNCYNCTIDVCNQCQVGYYASGADCLECLDNCQICSSATSCSQCDLTYSLNEDNECIQYGNGDSVAVSSTGVVYECDPGCQQCIVGSTTANLIICLVAQNGYSIVGGYIVKCSSSCLSCQSYLPSICTACYPKYTLAAGGVCTACSDSNALTCSTTDNTYSTSCVQGYTAAVFVSLGANGGTCTACAQYCNSCDNTGPGNCDPGNCISGSVQLVGTTNCSQCFYGCTQCSSTDPNTCLNCGPNRYINSNATCSICATGCTACTSSANNCSSCDTGYGLVFTTCVAIPVKCYGVDINGICLGCYSAYALATGTCFPDITCNGTTTCVDCPDGYYLLQFNCIECNLAAHCVNCNPTNSTQCISCKVGYYLDDNHVCQSCPANCLSCYSDSFCTRVVDGYFPIRQGNGDYSGDFRRCLSPCNRCDRYEDFCLDCVAGYSLDGSDCRKQLFLLMNIFFGQALFGNSIFHNSDDRYTQQFNSIKSFNRLGAALDFILPFRFRDQRPWYKRLRFRGIGAGSINTTLTLEGGNYTDGSSAASDLTNALVGSSIDGVSYLSSTIVASGFTTSSSSTTNLGLVLGLSIPLSILLVLIIVIIAYYRRKNYQTEEGQQNGFYSQDVIQKQEQMG